MNDGGVFISGFGTLATGAVTGLKVQQGQEANLSDAADLAGTALAIAATDDNKLLVLGVFRPAESYVRAVVTRGMADAVIDCVFAIPYGPRQGPVVRDSTVAEARRMCRRLAVALV